MTSAKNLIFLTDTADINCGYGVTCKMTFRPSAIVTNADEGFENRDDPESLADYLCTAITAWEMTGPVPIETLGTIQAGSLVKDEQPVPLDPKIVKALPLPLLQGILAGITQASLPKFPALTRKETP